ncbi:AAA family ATPase [Actinomadura kijaniata]|uniref:ATP-binding protein n=1 Tax=Actinomadura kijaniata TaxID=46161 RepID=UPI003F1A4C53
MQFRVRNWRDDLSEPGVYLIRDNWDDFGFKTLFDLHYRNSREIRSIGQVKIGQQGMRGGPPSWGRVALPEQFDRLDDTYFSLGQDASYYENLRQLPRGLSAEILVALRDLAVDVTLFDQVLQEPVVQTSLLRNVTALTVRGQFHRIAHGGASRAMFDFSYRWPLPSLEAPFVATPQELTFRVEPESKPPTNLHAVIGSNGVGKTRLLQNLARAVAASDADPRHVGAVTDLHDPDSRTAPFANLVAVSFSAFDQFPPFTDTSQTLGAEGVKRTLVTLDYPLHDELHPHDIDMEPPPILMEVAAPDDGPGGVPELAEDEHSQPYSYPAEVYSRLLAQGFTSERYRRWEAAVRTLEADPLFADAQVIEHSTVDDLDPRDLFDRLSSGHKIVLLAITHLAALVTERTLVLIDEPETHLHPPLLATLLRAVSDLLIDHNGVAIITTHSPVVLQEIPRHCVYKLHRVGDALHAARPSIETYGENVGVLTREVFGLEVAGTGFHRELAAAAAEGLTFEQIQERFGHRLGREAQAIARALVHSRDQDDRDQDDSVGGV